jgi:hypothetical protein
LVIALPGRAPLPACARPQISQPEGTSQSTQGPIEGALAQERDHTPGRSSEETPLVKTTPLCRDFLFSQFPDIDLELLLGDNDRALPRRAHLKYHGGLSVPARLA